MKKRAFFLVLVVIILAVAFSIHKRDMQYYMTKAEKSVKDGYIDLAMSSWKRALSYSIKEYGETSVETAEIYRKMGGASTSIDESFQYLGKAKDIFEGLGELCGLGRTYHFYATKCMDMGEREVGLKYLKQAEELYAKSESVPAIQKVELYTDIGNYTYDQDVSLVCYLKCENIISDLKKEGSLSTPQVVYINIANKYYDMGNYEDAISYYQKAIENHVGTEKYSEQNLAIAYDFCGYSYVYLKDFDSAEEYIQKAINIYERIKSEEKYRLLASVYGHMSDIYYLKKDYKQAIEYGIKACQCYASQKTLLNDDILKFKKLKEDLQSTYEKAELSGDFEDWFRDNVKIKTKSVEVQLR